MSLNSLKSVIDFEFDHIGVACDDLNKGLEFYKAMGWREFHIEEVPTEKVRVAFVAMANNANIELLEPTSPDSVIAKYLAKRGPGIHHICIRVKKIELVMQRLRESGYQLLDEKPRPGAHNCQVAFIHPKSAGGVLIELSEKMKI